MDADLVVFDPEHRSTVDPAELLHRHPTTPYAGRTLDGRVVTTYVRGMEVFADGRIVDPRAGTLLPRAAA
jgi:allantoinase